MSEQVPEGWEIKRIGELGDIVTGFTPSTTDSTYWNGEIPFISPADFNGNLYVKETNKTVTRLGASKGRLLPEQSILVTCIGSLGGIAIASEECVTNQQINAVVTNNKIDARCTYYVILHNIGELERNSGTTTIPIINKTTFSEIRLPFPPLPEQKKIASILTSVDEVIEKTQSQIDKLQDLKKGTMNELLTKGIGHTEFKDSELGRIPKSWEVSTIRQLISKVIDNRGKTPPLGEEGRELIELASISKSHRFLDYNLSKKRVSEETYRTWFRNGHPEIGDILVPTVGLIGECSIVTEDRGCIAQNVIGLRCSDYMLGGYLYWMMYSEYVLSEIRRVLMGAVQPSLKVPHLLDARIPLPPMDEQKRILQILNTIEDAVITNQKKVGTIQSLKKSLMQDLLTGKVRVSVN